MNVRAGIRLGSTRECKNGRYQSQADHQDHMTLKNWSLIIPGLRPTMIIWEHVWTSHRIWHICLISGLLPMTPALATPRDSPLHRTPTSQQYLRTILNINSLSKAKWEDFLKKLNSSLLFDHICTVLDRESLIFILFLLNILYYFGSFQFFLVN